MTKMNQSHSLIRDPDNFQSLRHDDENSMGDFLEMTRDERGQTQVFKVDRSLTSIQEFNSIQKDKIEEIDDEAKNIQTIDTMCPHV